MKYLDEYRDPPLARALLRRIAETATRRWVIMEICGGQTRSIVRHGIDELLPETIELVHGPGCPVCVTPLELIDRAHAIAQRDDVTFVTFGDMLRVPGSNGDLLTLRARGADVRVVYSPLDAVRIAQAHPERRVVFFAVGFETTAPANAMALVHAKRAGAANFSMLVAHVLVPPAVASIARADDRRVQAFLGPGHVCAISGEDAYVALAAEHRTPIVITGFEPIDLLEGIHRAVLQLESGRAELENAYTRAVDREGNAAARRVVSEVFDVVERTWRGIGVIPSSGHRISDAYAAHDAERIFELGDVRAREPERCMSGLVLQGLRKPSQCPAFGVECTPETPLGATMVSAEGACSAYYESGRRRLPIAVDPIAVTR